MHVCIYCIYLCEIYFKTFSHRIVEVIKSEIREIDWQPEYFKTRAKLVTILRQTFYFLRENSVLLLNPFNWLDMVHPVIDSNLLDLLKVSGVLQFDAIA